MDTSLEVYSNDQAILEALFEEQTSLKSAYRYHGTLKEMWKKLPVIHNINNWDEDVIDEIAKYIDSKEVAVLTKRFYLLALEKVLDKSIKSKDEKKNLLEYIQSYRTKMHNTSIESKDEEFATINQIENILTLLKPNQWKEINDSHVFYIEFALLALSGMRIGGLCVLKKDDIQITGRTLEVQEKATKYNRINRYFFPIGFTTELNSYMEEIDSDYIIPRLDARNEISIRTRIYGHYTNIGLNPHKLRDAINSSWASLGMDESACALMLNQNPTGVNAKHYKRKFKSAPVKRFFYDKFFPYRQWLQKTYGFNYLAWLKSEYPNYGLDEIRDELISIDNRTRNDAIRNGIL